MAKWSIEKFIVPDLPDQDRFHDFALPSPMMRAIQELEYEYCTPIQSQVLPLSLADYDITGQAQTGTGKTAGRRWAVLLETRIDVGCRDADQAEGRTTP